MKGLQIASAVALPAAKDAEKNNVVGPREKWSGKKANFQKRNDRENTEPCPTYDSRGLKEPTPPGGCWERKKKRGGCEEKF